MQNFCLTGTGITWHCIISLWSLFHNFIFCLWQPWTWSQLAASLSTRNDVKVYFFLSLEFLPEIHDKGSFFFLACMTPFVVWNKESLQWQIRLLSNSSDAIHISVSCLNKTHINIATCACYTARYVVIKGALKNGQSSRIWRISWVNV
jgi:hypothetical protein